MNANIPRYNVRMPRPDAAIVVFALTVMGAIRDNGVNVHLTGELSDIAQGYELRVKKIFQRFDVSSWGETYDVNGEIYFVCLTSELINVPPSFVNSTRLELGLR